MCTPIKFSDLQANASVCASVHQTERAVCTMQRGWGDGGEDILLKYDETINNDSGTYTTHSNIDHCLLDIAVGNTRGEMKI